MKPWRIFPTALTNKTQLGNKARKDQSGEAIAMIYKIKNAKNHVQSINEFVKAELKLEKIKTKPNAQVFLDKVVGMRNFEVTTAMIPTCLAAFTVYEAVLVYACDSQWTDCIRATAQSAIDIELGSGVGSTVKATVQMKAASIFLSEYVRRQTDKKMPCDDLRSATSNHCLALAVEHEPLRLFSDAVDIVMKRQGDLLKMRQAHRTCMFGVQC